MLGLLVNLVSGTLLIVAVVRAATPAGPHEDVLRLRVRRAQWLTVAFAILVSLSRVYNGVHYPTDVLVGAIVGAGTGCAGVDTAIQDINIRNGRS